MAGVLGAGLILQGGDNRAFGLALLVSFVFHALLLFAFPALREGKQRPSVAPGPIVARLVSPRPAAAPAAEQRAAERRIEAPPVAKPGPAPVPRPSPEAKAAPETKSSAPADRSAPSEAPSQAPAAPAAVSAPAAAPGPIARADPQPSAPAAVPSADDAGTLAQYRLALIATARKYKRYPRVAMDNNWEGTAEIELVIGANGTIASARVRSSAGHDVLDQQALDMFKKAKPLVPIPAALRGKEFSVVLRAIYSLKDPES
jgi:protein TonB